MNIDAKFWWYHPQQGRGALNTSSVWKTCDCWPESQHSSNTVLTQGRRYCKPLTDKCRYSVKTHHFRWSSVKLWKLVTVNGGWIYSALPTVHPSLVLPNEWFIVDTLTTELEHGRKKLNSQQCWWAFSFP